MPGALLDGFDLVVVFGGDHGWKGHGRKVRREAQE
jgi:hypothetical protein